MSPSCDSKCKDVPGLATPYKLAKLRSQANLALFKGQCKALAARQDIRASEEKKFREESLAVEKEKLAILACQDEMDKETHAMAIELHKMRKEQILLETEKLRESLKK